MIGQRQRNDVDAGRLQHLEESFGACHAGCSDDGIAGAVAVSGSTVYRTKQRFVDLVAPLRQA